MATITPTPNPTPTPTPSTVYSFSLAGYVATLVVLFAVTPIVILLVRRYRLADKFSLERFVTKVPFERLKLLVLQNRELSRRPFSQQVGIC
jgi:hypothetical protein